MGDLSGLDMPVGLATVIGERPGVARDLSPRLPSAPPVVLSADALAPVDGDGALVAFLRTIRGRTEPVVVSITGPVTLDLDLRRHGLDAVDAARTASRSVSRAASSLLDTVQRIVPGAAVLLFLQEPVLANSMHPTFPLGADEISDLVSDVVDEVDATHPGDDVVLGLQVDGRADWAMLLRTGIGALAAPISAHLETAAAEIDHFLRSGGIVAWGAVPVDEPLGVSADRLWKRLSDLWCELSRRGIDPLLLRERSIITPAAGLGNFGLSQAQRILTLTEDLATRVLRQSLGVRLSIGA
jgi:hypothetical protein